VANILEPIKKY